MNSRRIEIALAIPRPIGHLYMVPNQIPDLMPFLAGAILMKNTSNPRNEQAWQGKAYEAWVRRFGTPVDAAAKIANDPRARLFPIYQHFGEVPGKRIANLMGSNGVKAVALALLGADVTVVDYAEGNARYARELATEAGVSIRYLLSDVLELPDEELVSQYDLVFAELGIAHYFTDLNPLMEVVRRLLVVGGRFVLRDFHPVSTKLLSYRGTTAKIRKYKVTGDYFDSSLEEKEAPYVKFLDPDHSEDGEKVLWRKWTLGEVISAVASSGLFIRILREEPNLSSEVFDKGIPKTYTLVAGKIAV